MSQLDASVLQDIGKSFQPVDAVGAMSRGQQLKSQIRENKIGDMQLEDAENAKLEQKNMANTLKNFDLSTDEGVAKAAEALTKSGHADKAMDLMKERNTLKATDYKAKYEQMQYADGLQDKVVSSLGDIYNKIAPLEGKVPPAQLDAMVAAEMPNQLKAFQQRYADNADLTKLSQGFLQNPQSMTYAGLKSAYLNSSRAHEQHKQQMEDIKAKVELQNSDTARRREEDYSRGIDVKRETVESKSFTPEEGDLMGALAVKGVAIPAGMRSQAQMKATFSALIRNNPDKTPEQIAEDVKSGKLQFSAENKEITTAAGIAGKIRYAENEIKQLSPLVLKISNEIPRGKFVPWNQLKQMVMTKNSDPQLKKLKSYLNTLSNSYDMLAARGGTDKDKRAHNREMFDSADSPEALQAAVEAIVTEADISDKAATESMVPTAGGKDQQETPKDGDYSHLWN